MHEIEQNFQFLLVEVERQIEGALAVVETMTKRASPGSRPATTTSTT